MSAIVIYGYTQHGRIKAYETATATDLDVPVADLMARAQRIVVTHECPPIAVRSYDYMATREGYEPGDAIGHGETAEKATAELLEQEELRAAT